MDFLTTDSIDRIELIAECTMYNNGIGQNAFQPRCCLVTDESVYLSTHVAMAVANNAIDRHRALQRPAASFWKR